MPLPSPNTIYLPGINQLVDLTFSIEGKTLSYYRDFELKQSSQTHHEFTASFSHDCLGGIETHEMEESQKFVGKRLLVSMHYKNNTDKPRRYFVGVITTVSFEQAHGSQGYLILKGFSPTVLLAPDTSRIRCSCPGSHCKGLY